jgi:hypothetical protein
VLRSVANEPRWQQCFHFAWLDTTTYASFPAFVRKLKSLGGHCRNRQHLDLALKLADEGKTSEAIREGEAQLKENPVPDETYFLLERLYSDVGQADSAKVIIASYFAVEADSEVKCKNFAQLPERARVRLDEKLAEDLAKECRDR